VTTLNRFLVRSVYLAWQKKPVTTRSGRFFKLAGMTASVAGQFAGQKARSFFSSENDEGARSESYSRMAARITDTLGEMKGAAMKVGQIASQTQDFLPREFSDALQKASKRSAAHALRSDSPAN